MSRGEREREVVSRVIAIGDLHGDLTAAYRVLFLSGLVCGQSLDTRAEWCGGDTILVQVGDQVQVSVRVRGLD